ncbi:tyrosine-protein phosphatase non-receptor type 23-like [Prorops nasuta]|uniref:tyrosine-protein phosphatase non-receptor type 23-like n=1 Tax=Prorops nasuta TaxID=863751 RepID=UPI0034CF84DE
MEAVPRLPMVSFHLKVSPEPTAFGPKLKQYIRDFYNEDPESYSNEIHQLESLRAMAVRPPIDIAGCLLLKKYYCQLHFLQSRFPMGKEGAAAVTFTWRNSFTNMVSSFANIKFEIISVLYNIGAMHTQLGAQTERTSAEGMKVACAHFQCAAWAFEHLKSNFSQPTGVDIGQELMTFMHQLCLAQAQECILEKSMLDNRKPTIVAKVARQIVDYLGIALNTLEQGGGEEEIIPDLVTTKIYKSWKRYVKFKKAYHLAVTQLYQGLAAEEQRKMGERVAFYNAASAALTEAQTIYIGTKGFTGLTGSAEEKATVEEALTFTNDVIEGKRKAAKNENEFIYHEEVPEKDILPVIKPASLVKGISFTVNDSEVSGPDIFARLVPMKIHEANSLYSEEKAKLLRSIGSKVDEKNQQLSMFLSSLKLDHMNLWDPDMQGSDWERLPLPDELIEKCAAVNANPHMIQELLDVMEKLTETSQDVEKLLKEIQKLLLEEEQKEKNYQDAVGKRPPTIVATDLTREAKKYEEAHNKASESNQALHKAITMHVKNLKILSQPLNNLVAYVPSPITFLEQNNDKSQGRKEMDKVHVKELKRILNKVDEMRKQRNDLHTSLREAIAQDDLTRLLVTATTDTGPLDKLFAEQLKKHQLLENVIEQNLIAQDNILAALTDAYAQTADIRKTVEDVLKRRDITISSLITSYDAYEDLIGKSNKGLEFYRKLEINVSKLLQRIKSTCKVQEEEREQILAQDSKNAYDKIDTATTLNYEPRNLTGSGLKLKDYLHNRTEHLSNYSNQYYNTYKGQIAPAQNPSNPPTMTSLPPSRVPTVTPQANLLYYPSSSAEYTYPKSFNENTIDNSLPQSNVAATNAYYTNITGQYTADTNTNSTTTQASSGKQEFYLSPINSSQYPSTTQTYNPQSNLGHYQMHEDYRNYVASVVGEHNYNVGTNYGSVNPGNVYPVSNQTSELAAQMQTMSVNTTPSSCANMGETTHGQSYNTQQYLPQNQQAAGLNTEQNYSSQALQNQQPLPSQNIQLQNYPGSQAASIDGSYPQNYPGSVYSKPSDQSNQQLSSCGVSTPNNYVPSEYLQTQNTNCSSNMSISMTSHPINSTVVTPSGSSQYAQPDFTDQNNLKYSEAPYQQPQVMNQTAMNYPSYSNYQQGASEQAYQSNVLPIDQMHSYGINCPPTELIQSHTKTAAPVNYPQGYQYHQSQYPQYDQTNYSYSYTENATTGHADYSGQYIPTSQYQYNNQQTVQQANAQALEISQTMTTYQIQDNNSTLNNASINQTLPSQYSEQNYSASVPNDAYFTMQYGLQMQGQNTGKTTIPTNYSQTYMQAATNGTNTTTSAAPLKLTTKSTEEKSNVDLLSDLDITINHAPLVPVIQPLNKKEEETTDCNAILEEGEKIQEGEVESKEELLTDDKHENLQIVWDTWSNDVQPKKDPLGDPAILQKFISDVEKYEKFIDSLLVKTLSGATNLDMKWKEIQDFEERENGKQSSMVALAHASENRVVDCIPYDTTRVQLKSIQPSYINATHVREITRWIPTAFIVTQAPIADKLETFWCMIWEQDCEVIACLASDSQLSNDIYWPNSEEDNLSIGNFSISLKKTVKHSSYTQRAFTLSNHSLKTEKSIVHMQFLAWPTNGFPSSPGALLAFSTDVLTEHALRRCTPKPIMVHCLDGGSLSSLFLLAAATVCHIRAGCGIVDVPLVFKSLIKCRKQVVNKESLLFAYRMVLYHAQDILMKRGILSSSRASFDNFDGIKERGLRKTHHPSDDFLKRLCVVKPRSGGEQLEKSNASTSSNSSNNGTSQENHNGNAVDPLNQLDPMWSIRR